MRGIISKFQLCKSGQIDKKYFPPWGCPTKLGPSESSVPFNWAESGGIGLAEIELLKGGSEDIGESGLFFGGEMTEDEVDIAELTANFGIVRAEAEAGEILCAEVGGNGF